MKFVMRKINGGSPKRSSSFQLHKQLENENRDISAKSLFTLIMFGVTVAIILYTELIKNWRAFK